METIITDDNGEDVECLLTLSNLHYVDELSTNLLSLGTFQTNGLTYTGKGDRLRVYDDDDVTILEGVMSGTLCKLRVTSFEAEMDHEISKVVVTKTVNHRKATALEWHQALGHLNFDDVARLSNMVEGMEIVGSTKRQFCEPCVYGKMKKTPRHKVMTPVKNAFDSIHTDLFGGQGTLPRSIGGHHYCSTKTDQKTRFRWVDFLTHKDQALDSLKNYVAMIQTQYHTKPKCIRSDNGGEYDNQETRDWLASQGIRQELTMPDSPE